MTRIPAATPQDRRPQADRRSLLVDAVPRPRHSRSHGRRCLGDASRLSTA